jgi:Putative Ice-binding-like adhesive domain
MDVAGMLLVTFKKEPTSTRTPTTTVVRPHSTRSGTLRSCHKEHRTLQQRRAGASQPALFRQLIAAKLNFNCGGGRVACSCLSSQVILSGGLTPNHVIFNFPGTGTVQVYKQTAGLNGTLLAPQRDITIDNVTNSP